MNGWMDEHGNGLHHAGDPSFEDDLHWDLALADPIGAIDWRLLTLNT
jgi:hypothetical protein